MEGTSQAAPWAMSPVSVCNKPPSLRADGQAVVAVLSLPFVISLPHDTEGSVYPCVTPFISTRLGAQGGTPPLQLSLWLQQLFSSQNHLSDHQAKTHFPQNF